MNIKIILKKALNHAHTFCVATRTLYSGSRYYTTQYNQNFKIFGTTWNRLPRKFQKLGSAGFLVPRKLQNSGTSGYRIPVRKKLGTNGYRPDKKLWVPMGTGYTPDKKL